MLVPSVQTIFLGLSALSFLTALGAPVPVPVNLQTRERKFGVNPPVELGVEPAPVPINLKTRERKFG
ncbi:hypothetical protein PTT_17603, partial [Pyrenophora teres f. teres 0-1]